MEKIDERGFFEVVIKDRNDFFKYNLRATDYVGNTFTFYDPYCFMPVISDYDLYLFNEGNHHKIYEKLGTTE